MNIEVNEEVHDMTRGVRKWQVIAWTKTVISNCGNDSLILVFTNDTNNKWERK